MNIAVIGWGSLIWCPGSLYIRSRWYRNGPRLPIEFSRVSNDGRLTLVITPKTDSVHTLWALSAYNSPSQAAENLQNREGTSSKNIRRFVIGEQINGDDMLEIISVWLRDQNLDVAVWTALPSKAPTGSGTPINPTEAVEYINSLTNDKRQRAEEYVRNAPEQIETVIRKRLRNEFNWQNNLLSPSLFEEGQ